ncbi:MAG: LysR family transcriptional regulator [Spirochaetaceae bacterium]|nr:LysR family transcriptional regulator [Spirochaetaceae bacterium]
MNLNYIKTFYYTAKLGSITNAASFLDMTQPAATRQLQELQSELNLVLFDKTGKKLKLTDVGYMLYDVSEKIIELEQEIDKNIKNYQSQKSGNIKIIANEGFGNYYLPDMVILFKKMFPEIALTIEIDKSSNIYNKISTMEYDIGFTDTQMESDNITTTKIFEDSLFLIVSQDNILSDALYFTADNLNNINIVTLCKNSMERTLFEGYMLENNISANIVCEAPDYHSLKYYVKNNIGAAIAPKHIIGNEITAGDLVAIPEKNNAIINNYYFITHKDKFLNKPINIFKEIVLKWADFYSKGLLDSHNLNNILP